MCRAGAALTAVGLFAGGCGSSPGAGSQGPAGRPSRPATASAPAAAGPSPAATPTAIGRAAARYLAIAEPANRRLGHDFDDGLDGDDRGNLAASRADLRDAAATERRFDRQLLQIRLAPATEGMVRILVASNQSRARLTDQAARVTSLARLRSFERRLDAANVPVEDAVKAIRSQLGLPPPESS
jgi:hypothetical protein